MNQKAIDLVLSVLTAVAAEALSWPFWRDFHYWPVSPAAWWSYFALGFVLSVYVFYVFIGALHTLFEHDAVMREKGAIESRDGRSAP